MAPDHRPARGSGLRSHPRYARRRDRCRLAYHPGHLVVDPRNRYHRQPGLRLDRAADHTTFIYRLAFTAESSVFPPPSKTVRTGLNQLFGAWSPGTDPDLLLGVHHHQPHRQPAADLVGTPHPAGERVWIWLRPGLSLDDLQDRLDKIAVACSATAALAETASRSNAAFVRMDIKRRDMLTGTITSPLLDMIKSGSPATSGTPWKTPPRSTSLRSPPARSPPSGRHRSSGQTTQGRLLRRHLRPRLPATAATSPTGSDPARSGATPPPGCQLPRAARPATITHAEEPHAHPAWGSPLPEGEPP